MDTTEATLYGLEAMEETSNKNKTDDKTSTLTIFKLSL